MSAPLRTNCVAGAAGDAITVLLRPEPLSTMFLFTTTCSVKVPRPTCTVSPTPRACEMPKLIVRHGSTGVPQPAVSVPLFSTLTVADADDANAADASSAAEAASSTRERLRISACKILPLGLPGKAVRSVAALAPDQARLRAFRAP